MRFPASRGFYRHFQSVPLSVVPSCFKKSTIVPIPKKNKITCLNDLWPVALTPIFSKCFENLLHILNRLNKYWETILIYLNFHFTPFLKTPNKLGCSHRYDTNSRVLCSAETNACNKHTLLTRLTEYYASDFHIWHQQITIPIMHLLKSTVSSDFPLIWNAF